MELASVVIGIVGTLLGWLLAKGQERLAHRHYQLEASTFAADWLRDLRSWASEVIDVLSEGLYYCGDNQGARERGSRMRSCRSRLSALIDRGRFFLPNVAHEEVGIDKPAAYRGLRQPTLDFLVAAEQVLDGELDRQVAAEGGRKRVLVRLKRQFVSAVQEVLDPRTHNRQIAAMLASIKIDKQPEEFSLAKLLHNHH